jgi:hypothetical protein
MKLNEVEPVLESHGIDRRWYSLVGGDVPWAWGGQYCLERTGDGWTVFYREKHDRDQVMSFDTEDAACEYFVDWVVKRIKKL